MLTVRTFKRDDFEDICRIFQQGIDTGNATYATAVKNWPDWDASYRQDCRLVLEEGADHVVGYGVLSPFSQMHAYRGVAETSLYIDEKTRGQGAGQLLLSQLITASEQAGLWTLQAKIFPENKISIHLHEKLGFRVVGIFEKIGQLNGVWRDVAFMERRSKVVCPIV
ncbi:GNAT family N-acetyltransferase [Paremcibacter congregatus]|uniref:Phosphinothricin acetyltransferase n=1 Tax=Paremcibacter congregatus TaxID=2043170 RepID=A0A2G4YPP3_9PROT|nr:GNAT family N-acetyltransferase [Paremcibacter congregatus]PHZ84265.1 phosphinothricin acetyltransferase [Paremcibacter congregatus]QDE29000.1 N-acetyltransferase family protein [Paremcibacter congregatus]